MLNELKIRCFLCVCETLNFTEAGNRLYMSQQAVSKHISNLEEDLGFRLLYRTRNEVKLTSAGERVCAFFSETAAGLDRLLLKIRRETMYSSMNIRIGYQNWTDFGPAPGRAMANIRKNNPDLHLIGERHPPGQLISLLESGALDIILLHERFITEKPGRYTMPLIATPMQLVISRDNPLSLEEGDYRRFLKLPLLIDTFDGESEAGTMLRARTEAARYGFEPEKIIVVPNRDSIYTSAELGAGIYFGSSMANRPAGSSLIYYDTDVMEMLYCVWREKSKTLESFAAELQSEYEKMGLDFLKYGNWK